MDISGPYTNIRRFLELEKDTPINDDMNNAIPCLAKALEEFDEIEVEAASSLRISTPTYRSSVTRLMEFAMLYAIAAR